MSTSAWVRGIREEEQRARNIEREGTFRGVGLIAMKLVRDAEGAWEFVGAIRMKLAPDDPGSNWPDWDIREDW